MTEQYELKTLDDILTIPSDRLDTFFDEFIPRVKHFREVKDVLDLIGVENIPDGEKLSDGVRLTGMTWIDDSKTNLTTNITIHSKQGEQSC